ncbi:M20 family metallopeptidase [Nonomuraea sp. NPDC050790]|uniref:M20 family metallopeptidase n=1 Tax=Nonomuraea sp. NPDC050790 TaxID=3364371 RepID=UPI003787BA08
MRALRELRRDLHREPEVGLRLPSTQRRVTEALAGLPLEIRHGAALSSIVAVLRGARPGPAVLLRADMDALPLTEESGEPFSSVVAGAMHACGHDLHSAILVGVARSLCAARQSLAGSVVLAWQPGEEGQDGMALMLGEGLLEAAGAPPVATYGVHALSGTLPHGVFGTRAGASHAAAAEFAVRVTGAGGHGGFPHLARDPIPVAAEIVTAVEVFAARRFGPTDPAVVSFGSVHGGEAHNVIPGHVTLTGTARAFSPDAARLVAEGVHRIARGVAEAHGLAADVRWNEGYPPVINDPHEVALLESVVRETLGADRYAPLPHPLPAGDDYARVLDVVPGAFALFGAAPADDAEPPPGNHSPRARFDDALIEDAVTVLAHLTRRRLDAR